MERKKANDIPDLVPSHVQVAICFSAEQHMTDAYVMLQLP